jgi:3-oxoacyl-[acyl-carrier protein] reductase
MAQLESLKDKVCLITGGTRGIGRAIAEMLLAEDAQVVVCGRHEDSVAGATAELASRWPGKVKGKAADVRNHEDVRALFRFVDQEFGALDVLVNNAGVGMFSAVPNISLQDWERIIGTNLTGAFLCAREALARFRTRGGGYIVNMSSLAGKNAFAGGAAYNASKFGLNGFSEALMQDARYDNVRVSTVMPGSVATGFGDGNPGEGADWKVWPMDVAEVVRMLLRMPPRTLVSQVEVRPTRPRKN